MRTLHVLARFLYDCHYGLNLKKLFQILLLKNKQLHMEQRWKKKEKEPTTISIQYIY